MSLRRVAGTGITREPIGARRLGFTAGALAVHALAAAWIASRPEPVEPPVPLDVLIVPHGAARARLLPAEPVLQERLVPPRETLERAAPGAHTARAAYASARRRSAPTGARRPEPRRPLDMGAPVSAGAPPLEPANPFAPPLPAEEVAFSGDGAAFFHDGIAYFAVDGGWQRGPPRADGVAAAIEASGWLALHHRDIVRRIQERASARPYPRLAASMHWTGLVRVAFTIRPDGSVAGLRVAESSGRTVLDDCAIEDVLASAPFPHPRHPQAVEVRILYTLR